MSLGIRGHQRPRLVYASAQSDHRSSCSLMHQSFVVMGPAGPGNSGAFNFSVFKALLNALHCEDKFMVKSVLKAPPPEVSNTTEEQQMT